MLWAIVRALGAKAPRRTSRCDVVRHFLAPDGTAVDGPDRLARGRQAAIDRDHRATRRSSRPARSWPRSPARSRPGPGRDRRRAPSRATTTARRDRRRAPTAASSTADRRRTDSRDHGRGHRGRADPRRARRARRAWRRSRRRSASWSPSSASTRSGRRPGCPRSTPATTWCSPATRAPARRPSRGSSRGSTARSASSARATWSRRARADLVAGYVGQTALKVQEVVRPRHRRRPVHRRGLRALDRRHARTSAARPSRRWSR